MDSKTKAPAHFHLKGIPRTRNSIRLHTIGDILWRLLPLEGKGIFHIDGHKNNVILASDPILPITTGWHGIGRLPASWPKMRILTSHCFMEAMHLQLLNEDLSHTTPPHAKDERLGWAAQLRESSGCKPGHVPLDTTLFSNEESLYLCGCQPNSPIDDGTQAKRRMMARERLRPVAEARQITYWEDHLSVRDAFW